MSTFFTAALGGFFGALCFFGLSALGVVGFLFWLGCSGAKHGPVEEL